VLHFDPDGEIGMHEAGFDQLFLVVSGEAWLTVEGDTVELRSGEAGVISADTDFGELLTASNADGPSILLLGRQQQRRAHTRSRH
jgi:hypothetical protein